MDLLTSTATSNVLEWWGGVEYINGWGWFGIQRSGDTVTVAASLQGGVVWSGNFGLSSACTVPSFGR